MRAETYKSLARMFDYPTEIVSLQSDCATISSFLHDSHAEVAMTPYATFLSGSPLSSLQEEYVATFDFNPATAPYLGHHLFGDNQKKAAYMIKLKQGYGDHGYLPAGNELPDHISVVLGFMAHLAREEDARFRRKFLEENVLPGLEKLSAVFADRQDSPWRPLVAAARLLCTTDCKEVSPC